MSATYKTVYFYVCPPPSPSLKNASNQCSLSPLSAVNVPFSRWSKEDVCAWLHEQGLGFYASQGQSWIKSGQTLLQASQHDLEKVAVTTVETENPNYCIIFLLAVTGLINLLFLMVHHLSSIV